MASYSSYVLDSSIEKRMTQRRRKEHQKTNQEKEVRNSIRLQKHEKAKGMLNNQRVREIDIYLPVPKNTCNLCWKICKTESAKLDHLKDKTGPHKAMKLDVFCAVTNCGCVYTTVSDLSIHAGNHENHGVDDFLLNVDEDGDGDGDEDHDDDDMDAEPVNPEDLDDDGA